jgi:prephenate dehydratase
MSIEAMKLALEHLERVLSHGQAVQQAKEILRQAINQAEQVQKNNYRKQA